MSKRNLIISILLLATDRCLGAKILGVFSSFGYSQFTLGDSLLSELALKHHEVTIISNYHPRINLTNYRHISIARFLDHVKDLDFFAKGDKIIKNYFEARQKGVERSEFVLSHPEVQTLINSGAKFDVVIAEQFFSESLLAFGHFFAAPLIVFTSICPSHWTNHLMGNPSLPSVLPYMKLELTNNMNFDERFRNFLCLTINNIYQNFVIYPKHDALIKKYLSKEIDLQKAMFNTSLILLNSHFTISESIPLVPGMIEIGGFHIKQPKKLPEYLQHFLDCSINGAIYFSMGTNIKGDQFDRFKLESIIAAFSRINQTVLWKFDGDLSQYKISDNVLISKWMPQVDILAHPNIKLFITHGGLLSLTEAVYVGIPVIGIPIFGDQRMNIAKAVKHGYALKLPFKELNEESLIKSIEEVIGNNRYRGNAQARSKFYRDQPIKPLELAIFWIEYVIRHRGGNHLRFSGADLYWFQLYSIDVLVAILCGLAILYKVVKFMRRTRKMKSD